MAKLNVQTNDTLEDVKLVKSDKKDKKKNVKQEKPVKKEKKGNYLRQVADELKYVTWPTKKQLLKYSITTIVMVVLLALFFFGINLLFNLIYGLKQGW